MIKSTYDKIGSAYIRLGKSESVGTLEVKGRIRYRKPTRVVPLKGMVLLDFDRDQKLVGVEIVGDKTIPQEIKDRSSISDATVKLEARAGALLDSSIEEGNEIYSALLGLGVMVVAVEVTYNDIVYRCNGRKVGAIIQASDIEILSSVGER